MADHQFHPTICTTTSKACRNINNNSSIGSLLDYSNLAAPPSLSWPSTSPPATDVFDGKTTRSCDESPGSLSNSSSSITLHDIPVYSSDPMLDFSSLLSPTMASWTQTFLASTDQQAAENNLHQVLFQEDAINSRSYGQQMMMNSDINQGLVQDDSSINMGILAPQQLLHGVLDHHSTPYDEHNQAQSNIHHGMKSSRQVVKPSNTKQQLQFSNETTFWNPLASTRGGPELQPHSMMYHSMPKQLHQNNSAPSYTNLSAKSNLGPKPSNSTVDNKIIMNEPVLKKPRMTTPSPLPTFKVRKEKLGDRITALQQLVSPFGKTDTASVLHEAIDYIKFLHDQVRALSVPYLKNGHQIQHNQMQQVKTNVEKLKDSEGTEDLRSRGLCLVPISSTYPAVASDSPIDFWAPSFGSVSYMYNTQ